MPNFLASTPLRPRILFTLLVGALLTALAAELLHRANRAQAREALETAAVRTADLVVERFRLYQYGLRGARGAILTSGEQGISRELFRRYSNTRDIEREFPGARGFGFIRRVPRAQEQAFIEQARADGKADFAIRQLAPHDGERFVIQYIEPLAGNLPAVGLDIASETNRREAALASMRSGEARLTGPITLVQATGKPLQSFLILMPIYRDALTPDSPAERERQTFGWSYAPLLTEEVLRGLALQSEGLRLRLRDITQPDRHEPFYESPAAASQPGEIMTQRLQRDIHGRRWQIELVAYPAFIKQLHQTAPQQIVLIGALLTLLLAALVGVLGISRERRLQILQEQSRLAAIVESSSDGIIGQALDGRILSWNLGAQRIFGHSAEQALGRSFAELTLPPERSAEETDNLRRVAGGESIHDFDTQLLGRDGQQLELSLSSSPIRDAHGRVVGVSKTLRDISAQKAAEAQILQLNATLESQVAERTRALHELNVLLGSVLDSASQVSIIATDPQGLISVFNRGAERLLGYRAQEMVGLQTPALIHLPEEIAAHGAELSRRYGQTIEGFRTFVHVPEQEGVETREWTYVRKDGSRFPVTLVVTAMRDDDGELLGYLGIALDITQRKAAEQRLAESLETTRAVLDTAVNPVFTLDFSGLILSSNPAAQLTFGYGAEQMHSMHFDELLEAKSFQSFASGVKQFFRQGESGGQHVLDLTEHRVHRRAYLVAHVGQEGTLGRAGGVGLLLGLAQARLQFELGGDVAVDAGDLQRIALGVTFDLRTGLDAEHPAIRADNTEDRIVDTLAGHGGLQLGLGGLDIFRVHPLAPVGIAQLVLLSKADRLVVKLEHARIPLQAVIGQVPGPYAQLGHFGGQQQLVACRQCFAAQQQLLGQVGKHADQTPFACIVHSPDGQMDWKLRAVLAHTGKLQLVQATELNPRQLDYVEKAHGAAQSLLGLLNDILDYSKIEAGKLQLDLHRFELEPLLRDLAVVLAGNQGGKEIEVMFDLDAELPSALIGDSLRLQQVLINLAGNALKFTQQGQVVVSLRQLRRDAQRVALRVAVSDTGIGISAEQLTRIFDGFTQAEASTTRRFGGTGLGLVICKRLIELMGGELRVESQVGEGSRFWFDIELEVAEQASLRSACSALDANLRLLIADDNAVAGELLLRTAASLGWQAEWVAGGQQALARIDESLAQGQPFDLVLMDWRMPDLDGLSAAHMIGERASDRDMPLVVMITAHGREVLADRYQEGRAPFSGFLTKPVTPQQLAAAVQRALDGQQAVAAAAPRVVSRRLAGLRLLVVEDNMLNRQVAAELLAGEGAEVSLAEGGLEGVERVRREQPPFDAVLMDIQMPDIDGLEATRRIRQLAGGLDLPIIAMTANASRTDREACLAAGMNDHVGKPIDLQQLVATLLQWTGRGTALVPADRAAQAAGLVEGESSIVARFGGNLDLLRRVLQNFQPELGKQLERLHELAARGELQGVLLLLHTLKGSAGTMGASAFAARVASLEQQLKQADTEEAAGLLAQLDWHELEVLLQQSVDALQRLFAAAEPDRLEPLPMESWRSALRELCGLLERGDLQAIERAEALGRCAPAVLQPAFGVFFQAVEALDFNKALALGRDLLDLAPGG